MDWLATIFGIAAVIGGVITITLVMLSPRDASGLGDLFGGTIGATLTSSASASRNLDRATVIAATVWFALAVCAGWLALT